MQKQAGIMSAKPQTLLVVKPLLEQTYGKMPPKETTLVFSCDAKSTPSRTDRHTGEVARPRVLGPQVFRTRAHTWM